MTPELRQPPKKKLPFIAAFLILAVVFISTVIYGISQGEAGAYMVIGFLALIAAGLLYWFKWRKA